MHGQLYKPSWHFVFENEDGFLHLTWNSALHPGLSVVHRGGGQRQTLALDLEGGAASLPITGLPPGGSFELALRRGLELQRLVVER